MLLMDLEVARRLYRITCKDGRLYLFDEDDKLDKLPIGVAVALINQLMEFKHNFEFVNETHFNIWIFKNSKGTNTERAKFNQRKNALQKIMSAQTSLSQCNKVNK
jgi:hypothetical protein